MVVVRPAPAQTCGGAVDIPIGATRASHGSDQLLDTFTRARSAKMLLRRRVTGVPLVVGIGFATTGTILAGTSNVVSIRWSVGLMLMLVSAPALLLSTAPTDTAAVDILAALIGCLFLLFAMISVSIALGIHRNAARLDSCPAFLHLAVRVHSYVLDELIITGVALRVLYNLAQRIAHKRTARAQLDALWGLLAILYLTASLKNVPVLVLYLAWVPRFESTGLFLTLLMSIVVTLSCGIFCASGRLRVRLHAWLAARGEGVDAAAGIATLIGRANPRLAVSEGKRRLRAISCDLLTPEVFSPEDESDYWTGLSQPAELDAVDCFVSHSWQDDPEAKFAALQAWRDEFVSAHRREPLVWLDRCCIATADDDLPHLPIFIAACRQLLILAGPTYVTRLWCLVECFVFDVMAPHLATADEATRASVMQMRPLPGCDVAAFGSVDVSRCECALQVDCDRLLSVIESAHGSMDAFNRRAQDLLLRMPRAAWVGGSATEVQASGSEAAPALPHPLYLLPAIAATPARGVNRSCPRCVPTCARTNRTPLLLVALAACAYLACAVAYSTWATAPALAECARCEAALDGVRVPGHQNWFFASEAAAVAGAGRAFSYAAFGSGAASSVALQWPKALAACVAAGSTLARLSDAAEERLLQCILGKHSRGAWLGVPAAGAYTHWVEGSVLNGRTCPELAPWGMLASDCETSLQYVCEQTFPFPPQGGSR